MPLRTDYSTFRQPVDPAKNLTNVLAGLQGQLSNYERQKLAEQEAAALAEHRAGQAARAERQLSLSEREAARRKAQDEALGKALMGIDTTITDTVVGPTTVKEDVTPGVLTPGEQIGIIQGQTNLKNILADLQEKKAAQDLALLQPPSFTGEVSHGGIPLRAGETSTRQVATTKPAFLREMEDPTIAVRPRTKVVDPIGQPVPTVDPLLEQKIDQAQKNLALYKQAAIDAAMTVGKDRAVTETIKVPGTPKEVKLNKEAWLSRELDKAKELKLGGAAAKQYQNVLAERAEVLFPKGKPVTGSISITSPDGSKTTSIPYAQAQPFLDKGWEVGKPVKRTGTGKGKGAGKNTLISQDPAGWEAIKESATSWVYPRGMEEEYINDLAVDLETLQQLTGESSASLTGKIDDLVSTNGWIIGTSSLDPDKLNRLYKNKSILVDKKSVPIGTAMKVAKETDANGNRRFIIAVDNKGKAELIKNPDFIKSEVLK